MGELPLPRRACWTSEAAQSIFRTEALEGNEAIFLATHTPIRDFNVAGSQGEEVAEASEQGLLAALSAPGKRHAFCAIQGEPGSGKSHLIRWMYINWPKSSDLPILLQRSDGSLEGALRQLKENLPERFLPLFDRIGQRQKFVLEGQAAVFHSTLSAILRPNTYDPPLEDEDWCQRWNPAALLMSERALSHWSAPSRLLQLIMGGEGERNSASARFDVVDVANLVRILEADSGSVPKSGHALLAKLRREAEDILFDELEYDQTAEEIVREHGSNLPFSTALVDALNRRRNDAIQNVLGVSAEGLKSLFRDVRMALAKDGMRLVLLLEDITSWEGLDDSLIDVLVTNASTRDASSNSSDLCDLISVIGLTPQYMRTLKPNYRQRITHEVRLGDGAEGELQDVVTVRDPGNRLRFVSQYLAATRAEARELETWREDLRHGIERRPPNKCDACSVREGCLRAFGSVEGVGLFPFTENAIDGFYEALSDDDGGMTWKTPRGLIQAVLSPTLSHPELLEEGHYPGPHIERATFTEQSRHLSGALKSMIEAHVDSPEDQARLRRLFTFWGAGGRPETSLREDGEFLFHKVPRPLFEAFKVPWLGDEAPHGEVGRTPPPLETVIAPPPATPPTEGEIVESIVPPENPSEEPGQSMPERATPPPHNKQLRTGQDTERPTPVSRFKLNPDDIRTWKNAPDEKLRNPALWNSATHSIVKTIDPRRVGADPWLWERFLTPELVKLSGTSKETAYHFVVPKMDWVLSGLEAYAILSRRDLAATPAEVEYYRRQLARMMRHLEDSLRTFFDRRLSVDAGGKRWNPAVAAAQVLLVRAWLRRATLPTASTDDQFVALLSDETGAESSPKSRTQSWQTLLDGTSRSHSDLRGMLRRMLATPQGGAASFGLASGSAARDLVHLIRTGTATTPPTEVPTQHQANKVLEAAAEQLRRLRVLKDLPAQERELLTNRARRLSEMLRGQTVSAHAHRLDVAVTQADEELPSVAPDRVRAWKGSLDRLRPYLDDTEITNAVENLIIEFVDDAQDLPAEKAALLAKLIAARAGVLETIREAFSVGESAVDALLVHVQAAVKANPVDGSGLVDIKEKGARLRQVAEQARASLGGLKGD